MVLMHRKRMPVYACMQNARWELSQRDDIRPVVRSGLKGVTFFALLGKNAYISVILGLLGEFCLGLAAGGLLLGELFRAGTVGGACWASFVSVWPCAGCCWANFVAVGWGR